MAPGEFEARLHDATDEWAREGLVTPEQAERIRARHPRGEPGASPVVRLLYVSAGILVGAAGIALVAVTIELDDGQLPLALISLGLLAIGVAARMRGHALPGDALLVASLPPGVASGFGELEAFTLLGALLPAAVLAWRRETDVSVVAVVAFSVGAASLAHRGVEALLGPNGGDSPHVIWTTLQLAVLVALVARGRLAGPGDQASPVAVAVTALAISLVVFFSEVMTLESEGIEIALGACMLVVAGVGAAIRHRGLVLGGAIALALDAIAFGFDVGGPVTGTLTLLAVAGLLVWQAELVKRYVRG